jgi:hypothetical protein
MRPLIAAGCVLLAACANSEKPLPKAALEPKITQLYAPQPTIAAGELAKICYGVENAKSVWIAPPTKELSAALARCIEVEPKTKTTYTLTVEGAEGKRVSQDVTIAVGGARAKLANVNISAVEVKPGDTVTICYTAENARSVTIEPSGYRGGSSAKGCAAHKPLKTTTYVVTVNGADGDRDQEQVTVKVR